MPLRTTRVPLARRAHGGGIPAGGNEAFHAAARFGDIHHGGGVGIRAGHEEALAIGAEAQGGGRHAQRLARGHGDVDALHHVDFLGGGDAEGEHVIGVGGGDEDARRVGRRFARRRFPARRRATPCRWHARRRAPAGPIRLPPAVSYWPSVPSAQWVTKKLLPSG